MNFLERDLLRHRAGSSPLLRRILDSDRIGSTDHYQLPQIARCDARLRQTRASRRVARCHVRIITVVEAKRSTLSALQQDPSTVTQCTVQDLTGITHLW